MGRVPCAGPDAFLVQAYTLSIVEQVHKSSVLDVVTASRRADIKATAVVAAISLHLVAARFS